MGIRFRHAIVFTKDISRSKSFYHELLGQAIEQDFDTVVLLQGGLALHKAEVFYEYLNTPYHGEAMGRDNLDLYFTTKDLEETEKRLIDAGACFIHRIRLCPWGERVLRVRDPDGHIVEIGDAD